MTALSNESCRAEFFRAAFRSDVMCCRSRNSYVAPHTAVGAAWINAVPTLPGGFGNGYPPGPSVLTATWTAAYEFFGCRMDVLRTPGSRVNFVGRVSLLTSSDRSSLTTAVIVGPYTIINCRGRNRPQEQKTQQERGGKDESRCLCWGRKRKK